MVRIEMEKAMGRVRMRGKNRIGEGYGKGEDEG